MKNKNRILSFLIVSGLALTFVGQTTEARAWIITWGETPMYEKHHAKKEVKHHNKKEVKRYAKRGGDHYYEKKGKHHKRYKYKNEHRRRRNDDHSYAHGEIVFGLPHGYITIKIGGRNVHYHRGHYYRRDHQGYVVIPAPRGAVLRSLPYGYQTVYMNGMTYYIYNDVYYKHTPRGYIVIDKPLKHYPGHNTGSIYVSADIYDQLTIHVPNQYGGYTPVTLKRSGDGFVGPQGEYYPDFPKVAQLQVIYGD